MLRSKEYVKESSIHGFHFITESGRHWTERVFWMAVCLLSMYYTWQYLKATLYAFQNNAVSFVMQTDYLNWNTTFPSVSLCEQESPGKLYDIAQELYGNEHNMNIDFYLRDIAFFDGTCYSCATYCATGATNCSEDFDFIIRKIRANCENFLSNCSWNGMPFECCENFLPLATENGLCFTINSIHTTKRRNSLPKLVSNRKTGPSVLEVYAFEPVKVYVHSFEDVPYANQPKEEKILLSWGSLYTMRIQVKEIENDRNLPLVNIEQRNCRLPEESNLDVYEYYGYSTCIVDCRAKIQMQLCNCTPHYMPHRTREGKPVCGILGLSCLTHYAETLRALHKADLDQFHIPECKCMSSCNEPEINIIFSDKEMIKRDINISHGTKINIKLDRLPTVRYARTVVRTRLDLVVSIGSTIGLFLGASLLSFIELWYFIFIRMRSFNIEELKKRRKKSNLKNLPENVNKLTNVKSDDRLFIMPRKPILWRRSIMEFR